jgi:uncharacterized membrane protein (TIGR02234 family)
VLLAAANTTWLSVTLKETAGAVDVSGGEVAPALNGLALAAVACVGAASIAPRVLRYVLAGVLALLGAGAALSPIPVLADPVSGAEHRVSALTGVTGHDSVRALIASTALNGWPVVAILAGAVVLLLAIGIAVTARTWPGPGRRYGEAARAESPSDPWDALSRGTDPTGDPER